MVSSDGPPPAPDANDICWLPVARLAELYRRRALSPVEVVEAFLSRIDRFNPTLNAFVLVVADEARAAARAAEQRLMRDDDLPLLFGIPYSVKDNVLTKGVRTTSGSPLFRDFVPSEDAAVVRARQGTGRHLARQDQHAGLRLARRDPQQGFRRNAKPVGPLGNRRRLQRRCRGSRHDGPFAGQYRDGWRRFATNPGGFYGDRRFQAVLWPRPELSDGAELEPAASRADRAHGRRRRDDDPVLRRPGPARSLFPFPRPAKISPLPSRATCQRCGSVYAEELGFVEALDPDVGRLCREAAMQLRDLGWSVEEKRLSWPSPLEAHRVLFATGLNDRLKQFAHRRDEIEDGLLAILDDMRDVPPDLYYRACIDRNEWWEHPRQLFETCDLLITPTVACPPFAVGHDTVEIIDGKSVSFGGWSPYTRPFNMTGQPAISVPAGRLESGLPVGLQIVGPRFGDALVLAASRGL